MNTLITSMIIALTVTNLACSSHTTNSTNNPKPSLWKRLFKCPLSKGTTNSPVSSSSTSSISSNREGFTQMTPYLVKAATNNNKKPIKKTPLPAQERLPEWHGENKRQTNQ